MKKITVIGMGYMGLPMAALLSKAGHNVAGYDIDEGKVEELNRGIAPFNEPGLQSLYQEVFKNGFRASVKIQPADVYVVSVPTPCVDQKCDFTFLDSAIRSVFSVVKNGDLVIIESTITPGTCDRRIAPKFSELGKQVLIAHCPERAIPGDSLRELVQNDRIVGGVSEEATRRAVEIYQSFVTGRIFSTTAMVAECAKVVENTFRDVNIAFANELSMTLAEFGVSAFDVIRLANLHPRVNILTPGPGVGGHCIAVDPWFLVEDTKSGDFVRLARKVNDEKPIWIAKKIVRFARQKSFNTVGLLGMSYKKDVDDVRESPALTVADYLRAAGFEVLFHDPWVNDSEWKNESDFFKFESKVDFMVQLTDHSQFQNYRFQKMILDTRNSIKGAIDVHLLEGES